MAEDGKVVFKYVGDTSGIDQANQAVRGKWGALGKVALGVGAAAAAAGAAAVKLTKEVIAAYGEYEQLVGGVETLFKGAADSVMGFAENAFKTAGMSANEYMETVTGFSASLIQSLGGDTEKAALVADQAITDMADNANKMGTSMESIQNAYQGFAKQNYTMLDNLKLGYGGTKAEMERLLADAEKLSGIEYDISSFADITEAIHVIQTEMGITGTTAKEATETIQGSISGLAAAFENLKIGMGDANADFGALVDNVVEMFGHVIKNITPVIENIVQSLPALVDGLLQAFDQLLPSLLEMVTDILGQILDAVFTLLPELIPAAVGIIMMIIDTLISNLPLLVESAVRLITALVTGLTEALPELIPAAVAAIMMITQGLIENLPMLLEAGLELILALAEGLLQAIPQMVAALPAIISAIVDFTVKAAPQIVTAGVALLVALVKNLPAIIVEIVKAVPQIITALVNGFSSYIGEMVKVGGNLIKGLWQGISDVGEWLRQKISGFFGGVVSSIKNFFGIASPSKLFAGIGANLGEGLGIGFEKAMEGVGKDMLNAIPTNFSVDADVQGHRSTGQGYKSKAAMGAEEASRYRMMRGIGAMQTAVAVGSGADGGTGLDGISALIRALNSGVINVHVDNTDTIMLDGEVIYKNVVKRSSQAQKRTGRSPLLEG